ncbi:Uncharacterised protein [Bordetella pertussis]|nr:Uncharacterised protein [Bordetella pertussis]
MPSGYGFIVRVGLQQRLGLVVDRLALGLVGHGARLGQQLVDLGIAIAAVVQRALAGHELVDVAVRVDPARPAAHDHLEVAGLRLVEHGGVFGGPQAQLEAGLGRHGLDPFGDGRGRGVVAEGELGLDLLQAGFLEQRAGALDIALGHRELVAVIGAGRRERLAGRVEDAAADHFVDDGAVDRQGQRLAHPLVLERIGLGALAVARIEEDLLVTQTRHRHELHAGVVLDLRRVRGVHALQDVQPAGAQIGQAHRGVRNGQEYQLVEVVILGAVVLVELLQHDAVVLHPFDELVGARADRLAAHRGRVALEGLGREHHAGAVGQLRQQGGVGALERQHQGGGIGRLDFLDRGQFALAHAVLQRHGAPQVGARRGGVELAAVVELDIGAQLECQRLVVLAEAPRLRQLRHELQLLVDVDQLVAQRGEDNAAHIGAGAVRIEHVRVFLQADAQVLRQGGAARAGQHGRAHHHAQALGLGHVVDFPLVVVRPQARQKPTACPSRRLSLAAT